jgi:hypothetical protein
MSAFFLLKGVAAEESDLVVGAFSYLVMVLPLLSI